MNSRSRFFLFSVFITMVIQPGMGQFGPQQTLLQTGEFSKLQAIDIDVDGDSDLIGLFGDEIRWSENLDGVASMAGFELVAGTVEQGLFAFGDLDQNGALDAVYTSGQDLYIATGSSGSSWNSTLVHQFDGAIGAVATGDINGSGTTDLIVAFAIEGEWRIAFFTGNGGIFGPPQLLPAQLMGEPASILLIGDVNGLPGMDILVIDDNGVALGMMNSNADGSVWEQLSLFQLFDYQFIDPVLMDVDGDGDLDVAEANTTVVQWVENRLNENLPFNPFTVRVVEPFVTAGIGSFGHPGCGAGASVVFIPSDPSLPVYWRTYLPATLRFSPRQQLENIPRGAQILLADMNGDGREDLLVDHLEELLFFPSQLQPPATQIELPMLDTVCMNGPAIQLPDGSPSGGSWTGTWVDDNIFHRSSVGGTSTVPLAYTWYEPEGCPVGATAFMRVVAGPVIQPFLGPVVCTGDGPFQMTSQPAATEWSGLSEGNILDLETYDGGQIVAVYTDPTGSTCLSFMGPLNVWNSVPTEIVDPGPLCVNDGPQTIMPQIEWAVNNWGGAISGTSGQGAIFDPAQGAGTYMIWLQRTPTGPQQCASSDTITVVVSDDIPAITLVQPAAFCATTEAIPLNFAEPAGGFWSGAGVSGDTLDPAIAGPGDHVITYSIENPGGCANSGDIVISLAAAVTIGIQEGASSNICLDHGPVTLQAAPEGGEWLAPVSANGIFDPQQAGLGEHEIFYVYTDPNGCLLVNPPLVFTVNEEPLEVSIDSLAPVCLTQPAFQIHGSHPGIWSGAVVGIGDTALFDPQALGVGIWTVTLTADSSGYCPGTASMDIIVDICDGVDQRSPLAILIHPNPTTGISWLHIPDEVRSWIGLMDTSGRLVGQWKDIRSMPVALDLSPYAPGVYHLRILQGDASHSLKIVRE